MAELALVQFHEDKNLKYEVSKIYEKLGLTLETAFHMFMVQSKNMNGLPFEMRLPNNKITKAEAWNNFMEMRRLAADVPEMSLDEINAEIAEVRANRKVGKV